MIAPTLLKDEESSIRFTGWQVAAAAFVGVMVSFAPIIPYTFSLFLNPLHAAFGWQREAISGTFAVAAITVAVVSPGIGVLLDRYSPRRIILPSIIIFALALASLSRLGPGIQRFYFTYFILGLVANGTAQFAYTRTILTWFRSRRGLALALILTGSGVGSIVIPPLTQWVIDHHGWRDAYLMLGCIALLGLPLTALLVRNRVVPQHEDASLLSGVTVGSALRTAPFWILASIIMLSAFGENGLVTNLAAMLSEHGVTVQAAALALSVRGWRRHSRSPLHRLPHRPLLRAKNPDRHPVSVSRRYAHSRFLRHLCHSPHRRGAARHRTRQRSRRRPLPARRLLRPQTLLGSVRPYMDGLRHRRGNRSHGRGTLLRPRGLLSAAMLRRSCLHYAARRRDQSFPAPRPEFGSRR